MAKVISIEIGQALTEICVMNYKGSSPKVQKSITIETPQGVISDGNLNPRESFVQLLRDTFDSNRIREKRLVFTVSSNKIASREVTIPFVPEKKIPEVLQANAEEYFPVDLSDYRIAHTILGTIGQGKERAYKILVMAVPQTLLEGYFDIARMLDMQIVAIDYMGNSLMQATRKSCGDGTNMVVKIDGFSTMLMVLSDGVMSSFRSIPYGINDVVKAVQRGNNTTYVEAVRELQEHTYIGNSQWEGIVDLEALEDMNSALDNLINGISRVVDFHNSKPENNNIERVFLTGFGGSFGGMSVLVQERLGLFTVPLSNVDGLSVPREFEENMLGNFIGAIGAAINPLDLTSVVKTKRGRQTVGMPSNDAVVAPMLLLAGMGVVAAGVLTFMAIVPYNQAVNDKKKLEREINELLPAETAHNEHEAMKNLCANVYALHAMTINENDRLVDFIAELEEKMPAESILKTLSVEASGASLEFEVRSKDGAALILQQLRSFESLSVVDVESLSSEEDEFGNLKYRMIVKVVYSGQVLADDLVKYTEALQVSDEAADAE